MFLNKFAIISGTLYLITFSTIKRIYLKKDNLVIHLPLTTFLAIGAIVIGIKGCIQSYKGNK